MSLFIKLILSLQGYDLLIGYVTDFYIVILTSYEQIVKIFVLYIRTF